MHGILNLITTNCPYSLHKYSNMDIKIWIGMNLKYAANHYVHFQVNEIFTLLNCRIQIFHFHLLILGTVQHLFFLDSHHYYLSSQDAVTATFQFMVYSHIIQRNPPFCFDFYIFNHVKLHQSRMKICFHVPKQTCKKRGASRLSACVLNRVNGLLLNCHVPSKVFKSTHVLH